VDPADLAAFVRDHTAVCELPFVPGVRLHLATEVTPLWTATELFLREHGIEPPYWAFAWPGSQACARWLRDHPPRGRVVVDFAAGGGLAAIVALQCGARRAVAVEIDPVAGAAIRANAALNGVDPEVVVADLCEGPPIEADVLVTGDVCYSRPMVDRILPWLRRCAAAGTEVVIADPGRHYQPADGVEEIAAYDVPTLRELESGDSRTTRLLRLFGG
jgi:predicted nicotinamide N-methyase